MAEAGVTRRLLADSLRQLMAQRPLSAITVGDICAQAKMNRKSFYYHFRDKYDLVNWMFYTEFFEGFLEEEEQQPQADVLLSMCRFLEKDKAFWRSAMKTEGQNSFQEYLGDVLRPIMAQHVKQQLLGGGRDCTGARAFQTELLTRVWQQAMIRWVLDGYAMPADVFVPQVYSAGRLLYRLRPGNENG